MKTKLSQIFKNISDNEYCIGQRDGPGYCSTCGCGSAVKEIAKIPNITNELINIDLNELKNLNLDEKIAYKGLSTYLTIIILIFIRVKLDKIKILSYWLDNIDEKHIDFYDAVLFYVIRNINDEKLKNDWIEKCKVIAEKTNNRSLKETLGYAMHKEEH